MIEIPKGSAIELLIFIDDFNKWRIHETRLRLSHDSKGK